MYVTGSSESPGVLHDYATVAYDAATGGQAWVRRYDGPAHGDDWTTSIAVSPDGADVFVTGYSPGVGTSLDYATAAYDAATGYELWLRRYDGIVHGNDWAWVVAASPADSRVFVTGHSKGAGAWNDQDYVTIAYATT